MRVVWDETFTVPPDDSGGLCGIKFEDGGRAAIMYDSLERVSDEDADGFFVRLHSWSEDPNDPTSHALFKSLMGKRVRVLIEMLD